MNKLKPCPLCGSENITCFAEDFGFTYSGEYLFRAVVGCCGCHEEGCEKDYEAEPCFGIEAFFPASHPLIKDKEDPEDCIRALEQYMTDKWNTRVERTCEAVVDEPAPFIEWVCSKCKQPLNKSDNYCSNCGAKVVKHDETL